MSPFTQVPVPVTKISGFTLEVHDNLIRAKYVQFKPKKPSRSLEEYGLSDEDINDSEIDTVLLVR